METSRQLGTAQRLPGDNGRNLDSALLEYADHLRDLGRRAATVTVRVGVVRAVYAHARAQLVDELAEDQAAVYLTRSSLSAASRRQYVTSWRIWCAWRGSATELVPPRAARGLPRPASLSELAAAQLAAPAPVDAWIACGRWAGLRRGEVARLRGEDVDLAGSLLYVDGKGGQLGVVPLDPRLGAVLAPYVEAAGRGCLWGPGVTPDTVSRRAGAVLRAHGAAQRFHQLRHFFGTAVYRGSGDIQRAQRALRHASPTTTTVYALLGDDELAAAVAMVP